MVYPYQADDGREDETATARRVVRGGSWFHNPGYVRAAVRGGLAPDIRYYNLGFRLVLVVAPR